MLQRTRALVAIMLAIAIIVAGGCTNMSSTGDEEPTPTPLPPPEVAKQPTYTVQRGDVEDRITFNGRISPTVEEQLYFEAGGRVVSVHVSRGDQVEQGQLLAELDITDLQRELAQAQIELETAQSNLSTALESLDARQSSAEAQLDIQRLQLDKLRGALASLDLEVRLAKGRLDEALAGPSADQIALARSSLEQAQSSLWAAQLARDSACGNPGIQCDSAKANVQRAEATVFQQQLALQAVEKGPSELEILSLQSAYQRALQSRRNADIDIAVLSRQIELAEEELARAATDVDPQVTRAVNRATLAVERLEDQIADRQIVAPFAGRITTMSANEGTNAEAFKSVMVIANDAQLEVTAQPTNEQLDKVSEGMLAQLVLSQYPGEVLTGEIYQLPYPYGGGGSSDLVDVDKNTRISFDPGDREVKPGDLVRVDVVVAQAADALWLPPAAIRTYSGRAFVVVREGATERRADITIGITGSERVEIVSGLEEGQEVIGQ
ncbi:MAG: HlyD family efflux transporter periplasmic adaptor subunit [Chloroflexi bacterium]|nr:HlyD family efflux transporter periplasmic adaptor subunit [Chloroflexota bacterium]